MDGNDTWAKVIVDAEVVNILVFGKHLVRIAFLKFPALGRRRLAITLRTGNHKRIKHSVFDLLNFPCDFQCPACKRKCSAWETDRSGLEVIWKWST